MCIRPHCTNFIRDQSKTTNWGVYWAANLTRWLGKNVLHNFLAFLDFLLSFYTWFFSLMFIFRTWKKINLWNTAHNRYTNINNSKNTLKLQLQRTWIKEAKNIWIVGNWDLPLEVQIFNFCSHDRNPSLFFIFCAYLFMVSNPTDSKLDIIMSAVSFAIFPFVVNLCISSVPYDKNCWHVMHKC